jgi:hypothetical protein
MIWWIYDTRPFEINVTVIVMTDTGNSANIICSEVSMQWYSLISFSYANVQ